jgi:hypothetical protein
LKGSHETGPIGENEGKLVKFAQTYKHFTAEDWSKVMYSDESAFKCIKASRGKVRRPNGVCGYEDKYTGKTVKHPDNLMV